MNNMGAIIIYMTMAVISVALAVQNPAHWWNWAAAVFCFGSGIIIAIASIWVKYEKGE